MPTYAIGDIQGCYSPFRKLLDLIQFDPQKDTLWLTGDLVNRGPESLETLRFLKQLDSKLHIVLGNHDLHLLAVAFEAHSGWQADTLDDVLKAPDRDELINWLLHQPLLYHDDTLSYTLVHAGLAPTWDLQKAQQLAREVEMCLQSEAKKDFLKHMYGNLPNLWTDALQGWDRLRCITNYFTRLRYCHADGSLELKNQGKLEHRPNNLIPWFQIPNRANKDLNIIFGHWAALGGVTHTPHVFALDTGCVWGHCLTAMRLEDKRLFSTPCDLKQ